MEKPADIELAAACIYMPVHGHGLPPQRGIEKLSETGQFKLKTVEFSMEGLWEIQGSRSNPAGAGEKAVNYTSCWTRKKCTRHGLRRLAVVYAD